MNHEETLLFLKRKPIAEAVLKNHFKNAKGLLKSYCPDLTEMQVDGLISWWIANRLAIKTPGRKKA